MSSFSFTKLEPESIVELDPAFALNDEDKDKGKIEEEEDDDDEEEDDDDDEEEEDGP
jgi:hypothetical protein